MPHLSLPPDPHGALVNVLVAPSARYQEEAAKLGYALPEAAKVVMKIGSGSDRTLIDAEILDNLGLSPVTAEPILMAGAGQTMPELEEIDASLRIFGTDVNTAWSIGRVIVLAWRKPASVSRYAGIIGCDVLHRVEFQEFVYRGRHGDFTLTWN